MGGPRERNDHLLAVAAQGDGVDRSCSHERGDQVRERALGDLVVGADYTACGRCWWCRRGDHWQCSDRRFFGTGTVFGPPLAGAQAELVRVPHADTVLVPLPAGIDLDAAVFGPPRAC